MNSSFKRLGIIVMLLTSAVAVTGMGFGLWSQILTVNGTVQTGTVIAEWSNQPGEEPFTDDDGVMDDLGWDDGEESSTNPVTQIFDGNGPASSADPSDFGPNAPRYDKDVGICTVEKELDIQGRETILNITASNGYPSYWCTTHAYAVNTGSIPLKLQDINLIGVNNFGLDSQQIREGEFWCVDTDLITDSLSWDSTPCPEVDGILTTSSPEDFDLQISILEFYECYIGFQMDPVPSEFETAECPIAFHVEQGAEQDDLQTFQIELLWVQWNEFVSEE